MQGGGQGRIKYLDGLRGIAILLVIFSHYWGLGWANILPFGDKFGTIRFIRQGWVGVELFFLISGFVILITIERCQNGGQFLYRRWLRLFPAMLIATIVTLIFNSTIQPVPQFVSRPWYDALPGLTFVSPSFYHAVFDIDVKSMHNAFWSLYTEVSFYILFGAAYFIVGWKRATLIVALAGLFVLFGQQILVSIGVSGIGLRSIEPFNWIGMKFFLWFASGILFAKARTNDNDYLFALALGLGLTAAVIISPNAYGLEWDDRFAMIAVVVLFASAQKWTTLQQVLQWRPLLLFGAISYPLYLMHETIGLGLIVITHRYAPWMPDLLLPLPTLIIMVLTCYWVTYRAEPMIKYFIEKLFDQRRGVATATS